MPILESPTETDEVQEELIIDDEQVSPLRSSLFPSIPPTIRFFPPEDASKVVPLPVKIRNQLKWKLTTITPNLVRETLRRSGFKMTKDGERWVGLWGKHMKNSFYSTMNEFQKVNHFPGSFHLGRKDRLHINISRWRKTEKVDCSFVPRTFLLPIEQKAFYRAWKKEGTTHRWIAKPPASSKGVGVFIVSKWNQIARRVNENLIIQKYIHKPMLINGKKFDLRLYALVTCWDPLKVYVYKQGMVRFATMPYSDSADSFDNTFMHLTNYSLNKMSSEYTDTQKWSLDDFWQYLQKQSPATNVGEVWESLEDVIVKTLVASESPIARLSNAHSPSRYSCFELFGFDVLLDSDLKPWLLEVNISPSMRATSFRDDLIKKPLICDLFNLVGLHIPFVENGEFDPTDYGLEKDSNLFMTENLHRRYLTPSESQKIEIHSCDQLELPEEAILENLTAADVMALVNFEDELERLKESNFKRVVPSESYENIVPRRYWNKLLDAWDKRYADNRAKGRAILIDLCRNGAHLPTEEGDMAEQVTVIIDKKRAPSRKKPNVRLGNLGRLFIPNKIPKYSDKRSHLSRSVSTDSFVSLDSYQTDQDQSSPDSASIV